MSCFYSRASGTKYALIGKKLMFAKDAASALLEARTAVDCLLADEEAMPGLGGFAINVEDDDDNLLFIVSSRDELPTAG